MSKTVRLYNDGIRSQRVDLVDRSGRGIGSIVVEGRSYLEVTEAEASSDRVVRAIERGILRQEDASKPKAKKQPQTPKVKAAPKGSEADKAAEGDEPKQNED